MPIYLAETISRPGGRCAGIYYFNVGDGILSDQGTDPAEIEKNRTKAFRMEGLLPKDEDILAAMTPNPERVFNVRTNKDGSFYKGTLSAEDDDYRRLSARAIDRAEDHLRNIRSGSCQAAPAQIDKGGLPCQYCDYKRICLFDNRLDGDKVRRFKKMKPEEVLTQLALDEGER